MDLNKGTDVAHMSEILQNALEIDGGFPIGQYKQFWQTSLTGIEANSCFLALILSKIFGLDVGDKSSLPDLVKKIQDNSIDNVDGKLSVLPDQLSGQRHQMLASIYFFTLYYPFDPEHPLLRNIMGRWPLTGSISKQDYSDELIKTLQNPSYLEEGVTLLTLVDLCCSLDTPNSSDSEILEFKSMGPSLLNSYLRSCLTRSKKGPIIIEKILIYLKHPLVTEKRMLALLHMLKQYFIKAPQTSPDLLRNAMITVKNYYLWPRPYGDVAREVLQMLTMETKSPGFAMRKRMATENPDLIRAPKTGKERTAHVLIDSGISEAKLFQETLRAIHSPDINVPQLQLNILYTILSLVLNVDVNSLKMEFLSKEAANRFYADAVQILNDAILMNQNDAEMHKLRAFSQLKDQIAQATQNQSNNLAGFVKPRHAELPPLNFNFVPIDCEVIVTDESSSRSRYVKRSAVDALSNIMGQYAAFADVKGKPFVKIAIVGNDATFHNVLTSYVFLKQSAPRSFDGLDIQFYMVPTEFSILGSFFSKYDGWYGRHVACLPRTALKIFPGVSQTTGPTVESSRATISGKTQSLPWEKSGAYDNAVGELTQRLGSSSLRMKGPGLFNQLSNTLGDDEKPTTPTSILRCEVENFFREAKWKTDVNIYQCECWESEKDAGIIIPFALRAEIGVRPYARSIQKQATDIPANASLATIQNHKSFKWNPPNISIKFTQMNVVGVPRQGIPIDSRPYVSMVAANVPLAGDRGVPPNPTRPWLEVTLIENDKKKKSKPDKDLDLAPVTCLHVSMMDLEADDKKKGAFHILLDNVLYGPFIRVKLSTCLRGEEIMTIPFMTFFPLDLPS
eukprot:TRINITY_DN2200_c0_g1_i3.p1 TRINITY_DN2200_c0_g1~~TRINITY_DN2200_c0_g1_i3.p1  ORF type:complete len:847 (-),score=229.92 TRINITY_DN2200_c0_g1_i3:85-2625(-)